MRFSPVDSTEVWETFRPLLNKALRGSDSAAEEVLERLEIADALLLESERSFVVIESVPCLSGFDLLVWAAVSKGPTDCIREELADLETIAHDMGARMIAFKTSRRGFERVMPTDWKIRQVTWAKEL